MSIKLNLVGKIIEGGDKGKFVKFEFDEYDTGGYYILISEHRNMEESYDWWVLDLKELEIFVEKSSWRIKWEE